MVFKIVSYVNPVFGKNMAMVCYKIFQSFLLVIILFSSLTTCFWPASYQVHLQHEENFEFAVDFEESDDEMEMFKEDEINLHNLNIDESKLERLHKHFEKFQNKQHEPAEVSLISYSTYNRPTSNDYKNDERVALFENTSWIPLPPYYGTLVVQKGHSEKSRAVNTSIPVSDSNTTKTITYNETDVTSFNSSDEVEPEYDYTQLKAEYYDEAMEEARANRTYNYTDEGKPEETVKDSFAKIIDFKMPDNCKKEEATNFGLQAVECLADDYQHAQSKEVKSQVIWKVIKLIGIWLIIGTIVVSILWCKFGWCCCCCVCCSLCRPQKVIIEAKKYLTTNPPGVLILPDGSIQSHQPSIYEVEAYDALLQYARDL